MSERSRHNRVNDAPAEPERDGGELPEGWVRVTLKDLTVPTRPRRNPQEFSALPYVGMEQIESHTRRLLGTSDAAQMKSTAFHFQPNDVLYGRLRPYLNKVWQADFEGLCSSEFIVLPPTNTFEPTYLSCFLSTDEFVKFANHLNQGDRPRVSFDQIGDFPIPLPPLPEQRRIVAKLELLLAKVSSSQQRLSRFPALLKRFRQSVLAAACSGRLTADWREENADVETAVDLLHRVGTERFHLWCQVAQAKARADGRALRGDSWKSRYEPAITIDCETLGDLPETWNWTSFDTFAASFQYGPRFGESEYTDDGVPTVRTSDMNFRGEITLNNPPRVVVPENSRDHFVLQPDDLVVTRTGATIGKCALYSASLGPVIASAYLIRYRLTRTTTNPRYLLNVLMSPWGQQQLLGGVTAVAQPNVNTTTISQIPIPLPPLAEQHEIVRRVEKLFAFADQIEARLKHAQAHVDRLTQSLLAKAFRGELVPTEHALAEREGREYESAEQLLARIRDEKNDVEPGRTSQRRERSRVSK